MRIDKNDVGKRLDTFLTEKYSEISRSKIKKKIEENYVFVNNKNVKPSYNLEYEDNINISEDFFKNKEIKIIHENIPLDIIYEDEYLIIVNKKAGMVVHPAREGMDGTLVNALLYRYSEKNLSNIGGRLRPGIVHRLDKETSGLIICAKDNDTHRILARALKNHEILREYVFISHGNFEKEEFVVKNFISRNSKNRLKMEVSEEGKYSETFFKKIRDLDGYTFGMARLKTGRTHQIRLHLSSINHPIVGDKIYSDRQDSEKNLLLHSKKIGFIHPKLDKYFEFTIEEPKYFKNFIDNIKISI